MQEKDIHYVTGIINFCRPCMQNRMIPGKTCNESSCLLLKFKKIFNIDAFTQILIV